MNVVNKDDVSEEGTEEMVDRVKDSYYRNI